MNSSLDILFKSFFQQSSVPSVSVPACVLLREATVIISDLTKYLTYFFSHQVSRVCFFVLWDLLGSFVIESAQSEWQLGLRYISQQEYEQCSEKV